MCIILDMKKKKPEDLGIFKKYSEYYIHAVRAAVFTFFIVFIINLLSPIRDFNNFRYYMPNTEKVKAEIVETFGIDALFIVLVFGIILYSLILLASALFSKRPNTWKQRVGIITSNIVLGIILCPLVLYFYLIFVVFSMVFIIRDLYSVPFLLFM